MQVKSPGTEAQVHVGDAKRKKEEKTVKTIGKREEKRSGNSRLVNRPDGVFDELIRREEDGVHGARAAHGDSETAIHVPLKEFALGSWLNLLASRVPEGVLLVDALGGVDGVYKLSLADGGNLRVQKGTVRWHLQMAAHEIMPQRPPDISTASFLAIGWSPPNVVTSCLLLSYTTKYIAVPSVSRTEFHQPTVRQGGQEARGTRWYN